MSASRPRGSTAAAPPCYLHIVPKGRPNGRGMWDHVSEFLFDNYAVDPEGQINPNESATANKPEIAAASIKS
jgi:hypothetical protein